jgi:DNA-directed RNA polymerase specialized sigma24 family protein
MESQEVKQMFSYFDYLLKQLLFEKYPQTNDDFADIAQITPKAITEEYRKFLDKVSIRIIIDMFEQEEYVNAILKLARVERIIIALHIIQGMELKEIAYLLNTSVDSVYTQKNTALKQLKAELEKIN